MGLTFFLSIYQHLRLKKNILENERPKGFKKLTDFYQHWLNSIFKWAGNQAIFIIFIFHDLRQQPILPVWKPRETQSRHSVHSRELGYFSNVPLNLWFSPGQSYWLLFIWRNNLYDFVEKIRVQSGRKAVI